MNFLFVSIRRRVIRLHNNEGWVWSMMAPAAESFNIVAILLAWYVCMS